MRSKHPNAVDLRTRVIATLLEPVARLSRIHGLSLDDVQRLVAVAYFRELKSQGMSWNEIAAHLGKSRRTTASLAKQAADDALGNDNPVLQFKRHVLMTLAREGISDAQYLREHVPNASVVELRRVLELLAVEGLVVEHEGGYSLSSKWHEILGPGFEERLDSLRHFLSGITAVIEQRFFHAKGERNAFARVLTFSSREGATEALRERAFQALAREATELDALAEGDVGSVQATVALAVVEVSDGSS